MRSVFKVSPTRRELIELSVNKLSKVKVIELSKVKANRCQKKFLLRDFVSPWGVVLPPGDSKTKGLVTIFK